ncbi:hypothetical protein ACLB2K_006444 [Fragaria x ananassa]
MRTGDKDPARTPNLVRRNLGKHRKPSHVSEGVSLAWGAQLELTKLKETLSTIKLVHKDAEKKQLKNPLITHWLGKLKDVCHDVDDVLDELEFQKLRNKMLVNNHGCVKGQLAEDHRASRRMYDEASKVIGRDGDKQQILKHLLNDTSIVGLGGLVYNESLIEENFETKMWTCVSYNFDIQTLVRGITSAGGGPKCEDESSVIMETKMQDTLRGLSHKDCMSLFIQRAFNRGEEHRNPHLIEIGEDIVNRCGGVPLAVATVGSMLYSNTERHKWLSVRDDDMWSIGDDNILPALKLSYDALPQHLKPCFAFCSLFPKDFNFKRRPSSLAEGLHCLGELRELLIYNCPKLSKSCKRQLKGPSLHVRQRLRSTPDVDTDEDDDEGAFDHHNSKANAL